jgi:hypothetical protein
MEHRYESRLSASLAVDLWHGSRWLGRFRTRDVGRSGMFIAAGPIGLGVHDSVRIGVDGAPSARHLAGVVVHVCEEGIGVVCDGPIAAAASAPRMAVGF